MSSNISGVKKISLMMRSLLSNFLQPKREGEPRTHDFTKYVCGEDYIWEEGETPQQAYMTGYGDNIYSGDRIILIRQSRQYCYRIQAIDYYSNPDDMWMASLREIASEN